MHARRSRHLTQTNDLLSGSVAYPNRAQFLRVHAREDRHRKQTKWQGRSLHSCGKHGRTARGMDRQQARTAGCRRADRAGNCVRNVVKFQIEKDVQSLFPQL